MNNIESIIAVANKPLPTVQSGSIDKKPLPLSPPAARRAIATPSTSAGVDVPARGPSVIVLTNLIFKQ
jgi:hypothetical protein